MSLKDLINQEARKNEICADFEKLYAEKMHTYINNVISQYAQKTYDDICHRIVDGLKESPSVNGQIPQPSKIALNLSPPIDSYFPIQQASLINHDIIYYCCNNYGTEAVTTSLILFTEKPIKQELSRGRGYTSYRATQIQYLESSFWSQYWNKLTELASADQVSIKFNIELLKEGFLGKYHVSFVSFGETINVKKYQASPIILYSYTK